MTTKEKAIELYELFYYITPQTVSTAKQDKLAKDCAVKCVDEIISACEYNNVESYNSDWWKKVKYEIKEL